MAPKLVDFGSLCMHGRIFCSISGPLSNSKVFQVKCTGALKITISVNVTGNEWQSGHFAHSIKTDNCSHPQEELTAALFTPTVCTNNLTAQLFCGVCVSMGHQHCQGYCA